MLDVKNSFEIVKCDFSATKNIKKNFMQIVFAKILIKIMIRFVFFVQSLKDSKV